MHARESEEEFGRRVVKKVTWRLIPFIFACYVIAYLDRTNIGFAAKNLQQHLGLSDEVYGRGAGLFFLGYFLFEIPSNLILHRVGARRWIARIMIGWGIVSAGMLFVQGQWSFYAARVALGLAEAGFFPGIVLYLTYWIPAGDRARIGALFMMATPIAMAIGGPISGALLRLEGVYGLRGYQWLFLLEGLPAVVLGVYCLKVLIDRPEKAAWLDDKEKQWLESELARERSGKAQAHGWGALRMLLDPRVLTLCFIYFLNASVTYGILMWLPKMLAEVTGLSDIELGLVNSIPFVLAIASMVLVGAHSDKTGERKGHVAACAALGAAGLTMAVFTQASPVLFVLAFAICQMGQRPIMNVFWSIPPSLLGGTAAAAGIATINAVGNLGGHFGADLMGWLRQTTGSYSGGLLSLAAALVLLAVLVLSLRLRPELELGQAQKAPVTS